MIPTLLRLAGQALLRLRYRVRIQGLEAIQARGTRGILFLPNHPALVDPLIVATQLHGPFRVRPVADKDQVSGPGIRWVARQMGVRPLPDVGKYGEACTEEVQAVLQDCIAGLRAGENILLYPAGRLSRSRFEDLGGASAVSTILDAVPDLRLVLVRTRGLWGSSFSWGRGHPPDLGEALRHGVRSLLKSLLCFAPRREVTLDLVEPEDFPRSESRLAQNRFMETAFHEGASPNTYVPYTPWEGGGVRQLPEPELQRLTGDLSQVDPAVRVQVLEHLRSQTGIQDIDDSASLARDLGLDSLGRMELQLHLEQTYGHRVEPEALQTVADVMLAASGQALATEGGRLKEVPSAWFQPSQVPFGVPPGATLGEVFLAQAARGPQRVAVADQGGGVRTYADLLTGILALRPHLQALPGDYVGIMLPASGGAAAVYLAVLFAGKTPVMVNWTAGARNLVHALDHLGVQHVLTAGALVSKVEAQGLDLAPVRDRFLLLEDLGRRLGRLEKLGAFLRARTGWHGLGRAAQRDVAVVLFTSGSENLPKAVPLTHGNLLANLRDVQTLLPFTAEDRMLGILPPFHSFGLTGTLLFPLLSGLRTVYHPNPTEGLALARHIEAYGVTLLVGTPTFLQGITRAATEAQLASLHTVITGAEKCPEALYDQIAQRWPRLQVLEGYGITECSPVVAANRAADPRRGTIGRVLDSLAHAVVDLERDQRVVPGTPGMLLVRGPSIFAGYLGHDGPSPFVTFEGQSWYRTGDLVREADGVLVFTGRMKRFVKLAGEMVSLPAIEEALLAAYGRPDDAEVILAVEATPVETQPELVLFTIRDLDREAANAVLRAAGLSPIHHLRRVVRLEALPVLGTGKTDYRRLKELLSEP